MATLKAPTAKQQSARGRFVQVQPSDRQAARMAAGRIEADLSEYWKPPTVQAEEGRVRRAIEDIHEARRLGITIEEYRAL